MTGILISLVDAGKLREDEVNVVPVRLEGVARGEGGSGLDLLCHEGLVLLQERGKRLCGLEAVEPAVVRKLLQLCGRRISFINSGSLQICDREYEVTGRKSLRR